MRTIITSFLMLGFLSPGLMAQISFEKRIELELVDGYYGERIFEFDQLGFLLRSAMVKADGPKRDWKYVHYNTDLEAGETIQVTLDKKLNPDETYTSGSWMHTLFKTRKGRFAIVSIDVKTLEVTQIEGEMPKKSWISEMGILGDRAYMKTSIKGKPFLFVVNWKTGKQKLRPITLQGFRPNQISLNDFQILDETQEIMLFTRIQIAKKASDIYVIQVNEEGENQLVYNLTQNTSRNIINLSARNAGQGNYIFTGTYNEANHKGSTGIFICQAKGSELDFIEFHPYLDLDNFLSYLPEKRKERIEKKKARKESQGKEMKIRYRLADHDIITLKDGYQLLGEAYYPTYRTESYQTTQTINGRTRTVTQSRQVFDGYQYTHALLAKFDFQGKLLWDQTFEMWPAYKPYSVTRFINIVNQNEEQIKLVFSNRSRIVSKIFGREGQVLQDIESEPIESLYESDKYKWTASTIDYWYDNYFLAYGRQKIKNKDDDNVKRKRKVYFISKIKY